MDELKPCPFCGSHEVYRTDSRYKPPSVVCHSCDCEVFWGDFSTDEWNTRPLEDELRAENAKLREALEGFRDGVVDELIATLMERDCDELVDGFAAWIRLKAPAEACAYCGKIIEQSEEAEEAMLDHVFQCKRNPLVARNLYLRSTLESVDLIFEKEVAYCPWCHAYLIGYDGMLPFPHKPDCPRQVALHGENWMNWKECEP